MNYQHENHTNWAGLIAKDYKPLRQFLYNRKCLLDSVVFVMIKHGFKQENQRPKTSQTFWRKQASKRLECRKSNEADAGSVEELVFGGRNFDRSWFSPLENF